MSELLRLAAIAEGYPAHLIGSHSLRKGGATAMLACTDDIEQVKRFGGWKSDAVHAYLYEAQVRNLDDDVPHVVLFYGGEPGSSPLSGRAGS